MTTGISDAGTSSVRARPALSTAGEATLSVARGDVGCGGEGSVEGVDG